MFNRCFYVYHLSFTIVIFSVFQIHSSDYFSSVNRYEATYYLHQDANVSIHDTLKNPFFSVYDIIHEKNHCLTFQSGKQQLNFDLTSFLSYEYHAAANRFAGLSILSIYQSPFLDAYISTDVYTTERRNQSLVKDIEFERFIKSSFNKPITGMFDFRLNLPEAYLELHYKAICLSVGKQKLRWGPGYKGTLGLSGTAYSPFYYYDLILYFGNILRMEAFLNGYDDESIYHSEFISNENIRVITTGNKLKTYLPRYCAGQRLDIRIGRHLQLGIYELVDFFGSNELNRFANPLQLYYLSNEASGTNNANLLGGLDFNLIFNPFRFYGEFINDDITVFEQSGNPDKYAFQLGAAFYGKDPLIAAGLEYTHLSRYIYGHSRVLSRHAHWGESMGWPWGNYMDVFTAYAVFSFPKNIKGRVEANYWLKGDGSINDDWYADGKPDLDRVPFFPENPTRIFSMIFSAEYHPFSWLTYTAYWEPIIKDKKFYNEFYTYLQCSVPNIRKKQR